MRSILRRHPVAAFAVLAYAFSWAFWIPLALRGATLTPGTGAVATQFPGLIGPAVAALVVTALVDGPAGVMKLLRRLVLVAPSASRFAFYALSPLAFLAVAIAALLITGRPVPSAHDFALFPGLAAGSLPVVIALVFLVDGYGEEAGWRGFALPRLQQRYGAARGALLLGVVWAGWHAPLWWCMPGFRGPQMPLLIAGFVLAVTAGSVVLARVLNRTGASVLAAALWHTGYNMASGTAASGGMIAAITTTCVMVWAVLLIIAERRRVGRDSGLAVAG